MDKNQCLNRLKFIEEEHGDDPHYAHILADDCLLQYIDDEDIQKEYNKIEKWYS